VAYSMSNIRPKLIRFSLSLWAIAAFFSAVVHLVAPVFMSSGTTWQFAYGWQREIAFFDLMLTAFIVLQLRSASSLELEKLLYCLAALSLLLGLNHFFSAIYETWAYIHLAGSLSNAVAVTVAAFIYVKGRKQ
jgi:hypothetical protein